MGSSVQRIFDIPLLNEVGGMCTPGVAAKPSYHSQIPAPLPNTLWVYGPRTEWPKAFSYLPCKSSCVCREISESRVKKYNQRWLWVGLHTTISKQKAKASVPSRQQDTCKPSERIQLVIKSFSLQFEGKNCRKGWFLGFNWYFFYINHTVTEESGNHRNENYPMLGNKIINKASLLRL